MYKTLSFVCLWSLCTHLGMAQTQSIDGILKEIEQNNGTLKSFAHQIEGQNFQNRSNNTLKDIELSFYYLPWGNTQEGTYNEIQLSQQFEFPTIYSKRYKVNQQKEDRNQFLLASKRQDLLLEVKTICLDIAYLNLRINTEQKRVSLAETLHKKHQEQFKEKDISILDFNKSKINLLQSQTVLDGFHIELKNKWTQLIQLNNGKTLSITDISTPLEFDLPRLEDLWQLELQKSPQLLTLSKNIDIAQQNIGLQKAKGLPKIALGVNRQSIPSSTHIGLYSGLSIPLWENKNKVNFVKLQLKSVEEQSESRKKLLYAELKQAYQTYINLRSKYLEFKTLLKDMNNEALLLESYQLGELSFTTYYLELQFFRTTKNTVLELEHQLLTLRAKLLKHQL